MPRIALLLLLLPLLAAAAGCQLPSAGTSGRPVSLEDQRAVEMAAAQTNLAADRFIGAFDRRGMAGVIEQIQACYQYALLPGSRPQAMRDCMVLDMTALRVDSQVSGARPGGPQQLPFFRRATAEARWARYAPRGNLDPGRGCGPVYVQRVRGGAAGDCTPAIGARHSLSAPLRRTRPAAAVRCCGLRKLVLP